LRTNRESQSFYSQDKFNWEPQAKNKVNHLLFTGFDSGFGDLSTGAIAFLDRFDDTNSNGLSHISNGKSSKRGVLGEWFDAHWLGWDHFDNSGITRLDFSWGIFDFLTRSSVDFLEHFVESASDVGGVAIQDWGVTFLDLTWVVQDDDLGVERLRLEGWIVFGVGAHVSSSDVFDGDVLDVEADVVAWKTFWDLGVVHLDGFDLSGDVGWSEFDDHTGFDGTGFDSADWHSSNTTDLVDVLEWESESFVGWSNWLVDGVQSFEESFTGLFTAFFGLFSPSLVPRHVGGGFDHVVSVPARDWDESDGFRVVTDFLDVVGNFLDDFFVSVLAVFWLSVVHLVDSDDELLDTEGESEESVFSGLTVLSDTSFELTNTSSDDEDGAIGLRSTGDHVLDEISVTWGVDDGDFVYVSLEFPEGDIDGDTTFSFGLKLVEYPSVLERTFAHFGGFLLELFDSSLVDTTAFVDQMTGGGRFTGIDVADNNNVDMSFCFSHDKDMTGLCKFDLRL